MSVLTLRGVDDATRALVLSLIGFAFFSCADAIFKVLGQSYNPLQIAWLASLVILVCVITYAPGWRVFIPQAWGLTILRSVLNTCTLLAVIGAFSMLPLSDVYALIFASPLLVTMLARPVLGEHIGVRRWLAVMVGFIGVLIIVRPGNATLGLGHLMAMIAACSSATSLLVTRKIGRRESPQTLLATSALTTAVVATPLAVPVFIMPTVIDGTLFVFAGVLVIAAQLALIFALRFHSAGMVVPFQYTQMLWAIIFGAALYHQWPDRYVLTGAMIVAASGLYILLREHVRRRPLTPAAAGAGIIAAHTKTR
ncbi:MAG: DMT family transporter [Pseudomonadota bacterium]